jgi:hypothetical protein
MAVDKSTYDAWFAAQVQEAVDDPRPGITHEDAEARFAQLREQMSGHLSAEQRAEAKAAADRILSRSPSLTLDGIPLKELIAEGRA